MRREQVVGAVVYGQFVPEESTHPPASVPVTDADTAPLAEADTALPADSAAPLAGSAAPPLAAHGVPVNADGVVVDAEGNPVDDGKFLVRLDNFTGPFDLLLQLIGKHKLDVTEVALHQVTDDFIAYIRAMGDNWDLGEASEFLLVAATLLDLKAARLLPAADVEDEEDLALLEARDLLFARLLQYKAYKEAASHIMELEINGMRRWPRAVSMEPRYAEALPELVLGVGPERLFKLALKQFSPKPGPPEVSIAHIHQVRVSVREHATLLRDRLRRAGHATFTLLVADCDNTLEVVARFLALLELYREGLIDFEQPVSLDELTVRWIGGDAGDAEFDIDDYEGSKPDPDAPESEPASEDDSASSAELLVGGIDLDDDSDFDDAPASVDEPAAADGLSGGAWDSGDSDSEPGDASEPLAESVGAGGGLGGAGASGSERDVVAGLPDGAGEFDDSGSESDGAVDRADVVGESPGSGSAEADDRLDVGRRLDDLGEEDDDARGRA